MKCARASTCGRFVVLDDLHVDRDVFEALAQWAAQHGLRIQDAIQLAVCSFNDAAPRVGPRSSPRQVVSVQRALPADVHGDRPTR
jgi:hypothetical protein